MDLLLDAGAPVNEDGDRCTSALQMTAAEGHEQVVKLLLKTGANVDSQQGAIGCGALQRARRRIGAGAGPRRGSRRRSETGRATNAVPWLRRGCS
jgi:ankyrin repeat protein